MRIWGGKVVVFGGQRVLSLSRTRARITGDLLVSFSVLGDVCWRYGPMFSGRCVKVGIVRCGRNWEGVVRRVRTAWVKPRRFVFVISFLFVSLYVQLRIMYTVQSKE